jgi:hypothetical protein
MEIAMEYELVKYKYGVIKRYTAFCLTPKLAKPAIVQMAGKSWTVTNKGISSAQARHYGASEEAMRWLGAQGIDSTAFDWSLLPGTERR